MADIVMPRPEYPRPQLVRDRWVNLNGTWEFEMDHGESGEARGLTHGKPLSGSITVPFCPESDLSGVGHKDFMKCVWYRKTVRIPAEWGGDRVLLHFGAVDYEATVWANGKRVGSHIGGYTSFTFDVTGFVKAGEDAEIVLRAFDDTRSGLQASGKQSDRFESHGCSYTRTTGIWQTVWLEAVPQTYLKGLRITPDLDGARVNLVANLGGPTGGFTVRATALMGDKPVGTGSTVSGASCQFGIDLSETRAWSVSDPFLYDLVVEVLDAAGNAVDTAKAYFGLRKVSMEGQAFCLNGKPVFMRTVLDQGFYPDGIYTAPTDEALKRDIELMQELGFNGARLHQKVFEPRFLYWADKLGYLVWAEYPNWGLDYALPEVLERVLPEWLEAMERDYNHPAIIGWCPFNETWGSQRDWLLRNIFRVTKAVDPYRPVIDTSGWVHIGETDIYDVHNYDQNPETFAKTYATLDPATATGFCNMPDREAHYAGGPYWVSEYGGIWWNPDQKDDKAWGYGQRPASAEEFVERYRGLTTALLRNPHMCGFCYTQAYDVEQEVNGLLTYGRKAKMDPAIFRAINTQKAAIEE